MLPALEALSKCGVLTASVSLLAVAATSACGAQGHAAKPRQTASGPLYEHVAALSSDALEGRGTGTPGAAAARSYIAARFAEIGLIPLGGESAPQTYELPFEWQSAAARGVREGINVAGALPGTLDPPRYLVLSAHYDHLGVRGGEIHNGADDNASGVAVLLELGRRLSGAALHHTVVLVAFDAEEQDTAGSRAFVAEPPIPLAAIDAVVNLDMVGRVDGRALWGAGTRHYPRLRPFVEEAASGVDLAVELGHDGADGRQNWTLASDHGPFHRAGVPFLYLGVEDHRDYHRATDDIEKIDFAVLAEVADFAIALVLALDRGLVSAASSAPAPSPERPRR